MSAQSRELPRSQSDSFSADELRDANGRLLVAGLRAQEQAELQQLRRTQVEAALNLRDELMFMAAHELRTPVTGIKIAAQLALRMLEGANPDRDRIVRYLTDIVSGTNRLGWHINDLMTVSNAEWGVVAPCDNGGPRSVGDQGDLAVRGQRRQVAPHDDTRV